MMPGSRHQWALHSDRRDARHIDADEPEEITLWDTGADDVGQRVSTGRLPAAAQVRRAIDEAYRQGTDRDDGRLADYIPILAEANPAWFAVAVRDAAGDSYAVGDSAIEFSIQSIAKPFVFALACEYLGHDEVRDAVGVNNTGLPFNSVVAVELNDGDPMNPMVNAGAIATMGLMPGETCPEKWAAIHRGLSAFAGRDLGVGQAVYQSESRTNHRNKAIARLLRSYGRIERDPLELTDVYTRACALVVTAQDLAVMGATLAAGGVNPVTGESVVSPDVCRDTLAMLATSGLYERSGDWLFEIGLPAKSGVSGGIVAIAPGKGALGTFSPKLDQAGNSVRGQIAVAHLSRTLGLNLFASNPQATEAAVTERAS